MWLDDNNDFIVGKFDDETEEMLNKEVAALLRRLMDWLYSQLEKEYYWRVSDEQVRESLEAQEDVWYFSDGAQCSRC